MIVLITAETAYFGSITRTKANPTEDRLEIAPKEAVCAGAAKAVALTEEESK